MKNSKKIIASMLAVCSIVTSMAMTASAEKITRKTADGLTIVENMINYNIYDEDMVYIQEHADMVAEYNAALKSRAVTTTYTQWNWSNGIYSNGMGSSIQMIIDKYFVPTVENALYFNAEIVGEGISPNIAINELNNDGTLSYIGTRYITSQGADTFVWDNKKITLTKNHKYTFFMWGGESWDYASIDIYYEAM